MATRTITLDVTSAFHQRAGIGRLTRETVRALRTLPTSHQIELFCMGWPPGPAGSELGPVHFAPISDRNFHRLWFRGGLRLPIDVFIGTPDLYHATDFILPPTRARRTVLTVHDLTFERDPHSAMPSLLKFLKRVVPASVRKATHIIADSNATASDLRALYGVPADKITVIYSGVDRRFQPNPEPGERERIRAKYTSGSAPYVLAVGTLQRRKNHLGLVRAFAQANLPDHELLIAGGQGWLYEEVYEEVTALGLSNRVRFSGFVDDADLPALYRQASALAFPSLYEGFGLPVLEAMASGTPVVTSNLSSLPEVAGAAGLLVNPGDTAALTAALERACLDPVWRAHVIPAGIARAATFTWERAAQQLLAMYDRLL
jgi:glycosyltransferase involved in cell wall biosynthesis